MPSTPYLLRLTPSEAFFFGSERTFGEDNAMYFVRSNRFPQQTTLLGIIRYKLLESIHKLDKQHEQVAIDLIGANSFTTKISNPNFGVIKALSPAFLLKGNEPYHTVPKDWGYRFQTEQNLPLLVSTKVDAAGKFPAFNPKEGLCDSFINSSSHKIKPEDIFKSEVRTGITKPNRKKAGEEEEEIDESKGFYKQEVLRFASRNWAFGVLVWLESDAGAKLMEHLNANPWARLGTENRQAKLEMTPISDVLAYLRVPIGEKPATDQVQKVILLSHSYADRTIYTDCVFAVTETIDFRNIETSVATRDFSALYRTNKDGNNLNAAHRSDVKLNLLESGSVFYVSNEKLADFQQKLKQANHFRAIGYNAYQVGDQPFFYSPSN